MNTILKQIDFYNDEEFSKVFLTASFDYLSIIKENNSVDYLGKIKFKKLKKIAEDLDTFSPGNEIRKEKKLFIKYLKTLVSRPIADFSLKDLIVLERDYLLPIIDGKLREIGWLRNYGWLLGTIFVLPTDIVLFLVFKFYYFPILSSYVMVGRLSARHKAKKENKLW